MHLYKSFYRRTKTTWYIITTHWNVSLLRLYTDKEMFFNHNHDLLPIVLYILMSLCSGFQTINRAMSEKRMFLFNKNNKAADQPVHAHTLISIIAIHCLYGPQHEKTCLRGFANNKVADQPTHPRSLIRAFIIRLLERVISKLASSEISIF